MHQSRALKNRFSGCLCGGRGFIVHLKAIFQNLVRFFYVLVILTTFLQLSSLLIIFKLGPLRHSTELDAVSKMKFFLNF